MSKPSVGPATTVNTAEQVTNTTEAAMNKVEETTKAEVADVLLEAEEFEKIYGKNPTPEYIQKKFKDSGISEFKDKSYDEILNILSKDTDNKNIYQRLKKNVKEKPVATENEWGDTKQKQTESKTKETETQKQEASTEQKIEAKKQELNAPEKPAEKPAEKKEKSDRRNEEDENARPWSKPTAKSEKAEKSEKSGWGKKINLGKVLARPFSTARKLTKTVGKTIRAPVGLTSYMLSDIWEKEKTGRKDRWAGYKKIRAKKK